MKFFRSLKGKIVIASILVTMLGFTVFGLIYTKTVKSNVNDLILEKSVQEATQIAGQAEAIIELNGTTDDLQKMVEDQISEHSYIAYTVVIDKTVTAVAHSDTEKIGKVYDDDYTISGAQKGETMTSRYYADVQRAWAYDIMVPITVNGELYGSMDVGIYENYMSTFMWNLARLAVTMELIITGIATIVVIILCTMLFKHFTVLVAKCNQMGLGDFSETFDNKLLKRKDEIGDMAAALDKMGENLRKLISETANQTDQIVAISGQLDERSKATNQMATEIRSSVDQVVEGSTKQTSLTEDTSRMMEQINHGMEEVADNMQNVSDSSASTVDNAQKGYELVNNVMNQMGTISTEVKSTAEKIQTLSSKSDEIESVVEFINGIASQTNLLALNASIEAARAGENGKGFAVVANQVGQLAVQSSEAANEIVKLIKEIQESTKDSINSMEESQQSVAAGIDLADEAGESFKGILKQITEMSEEFTNISAITQEVTASTNSLLQSVEDISNITRENGESTSAVSEAVATQNVHMQEIKQAADELNGMSAKLELMIRVFKM